MEDEPDIESLEALWTEIRGLLKNLALVLGVGAAVICLIAFIWIRGLTA